LKIFCIFAVKKLIVIMLTATNLIDAYQHMPVVEQKKFNEQFMSIATPKPTDIIGYEMSGMPITRSELTQHIQEALRQVEAGDFLTSEELEQEIRTW